ncbi:hypothetical protein V6N12_061007 [Hibiscus sabdariffa]|uniref:Retroviral polymerase SH3-like domain-containing protein n=1 Tax=Hibiscus sabdariffa TaxID=183260 RepID=A0ABR2DVS9_9ROSI
MMALKYKEGTSIADHVSEFQSVMNQLLGMGVKFDDENLGLWLLATLPDSWETFQVSLINSAPQGIIILDLAKSCVLNEEVRRRSQGSTSQSEVLDTKNRGETKKEMARRENKGGGDKHDWNDDEKSERAVVTREDLLVICNENLVNLACDETSWGLILALQFMSRRGGISSHLILLVILGWVMTDWFRLLAFEMLAWLDDEGIFNTFSDVKWKLTKGSLVVARRKKSSNLYLMQVSNSRDIVNVTVNDSSTELWHKRLRKQRRVSFSSPPPHRKSELLELVYSDVCGLIKDERSKLDAKTHQCIFIGYGLDGEFGYRLYDPVQKKLDIGDFDAPIDDAVNYQQQAPIVPPTIPLRRSFRDR